MKALVLKRFRDKRTGEKFLPGRQIEVSEERLREINSTKYGTLVEPAASSEKSAKKSAKQEAG